jgi:Putative zinc-finger
MNTVSYSCKKVAQLLSLAQDEPLSVLERLSLKFHLSRCPDCVQVEQQIAHITSLMRNPLDADGAPGKNTEG